MGYSPDHPPSRATPTGIDAVEWLADESVVGPVYERVKHLDVIFDSGGSCANTIATVGRLGGKAVYCGHVGEEYWEYKSAPKIV